MILYDIAENFVLRDSDTQIKTLWLESLLYEHF
jgi:hypothetical protein